MRVTFDEPLRDITPGQGAVVYDGATVLGGGVIEKPESYP
jgi:tRNA-specific 2-thiouridylase